MRAGYLNIMFFDLQVLLDEQQALINGLQVTILVACTASVFAAVIAALLLMLKHQHPEYSAAINSYTQTFRNIPLLIVLYFLYKGLPSFGVILPPILCGIIGLSLYSSAYFIEAFKAAYHSIPHTQWESGTALGLSPLQTFKQIILPQWLPVVLPATGNIVVNTVKNTALLTFITVSDLFMVIYKGSVTFFHFTEFFTAGIVLYLLLNTVVTLIFKQLEAYAKLPEQRQKRVSQELAYARQRV